MNDALPSIAAPRPFATPPTQVPVRYRVALKGDDRKTTVSVLTSAGGPDVGENGRRIAERLVAELR